MSRKRRNPAGRGASVCEHTRQACYLAYFDCFNRQRFHQAHDMLEEIWLPLRGAAAGDFYKGLIQLAGAFIHVQRNRPAPALALLRLAGANLAKYAPARDGLDLAAVGSLIEAWSAHLRAAPETAGRLLAAHPPRLTLRDAESPARSREVN